MLRCDHYLFLDLVLLDLVIQGLAGDTQDFGGVALVPVGEP